MRWCQSNKKAKGLCSYRWPTCVWISIWIHQTPPIAAGEKESQVAQVLLWWGELLTIEVVLDTPFCLFRASFSLPYKMREIIPISETCWRWNEAVSLKIPSSGSATWYYLAHVQVYNKAELRDAFLDQVLVPSVPPSHFLGKLGGCAGTEPSLCAFGV